MVSLRTELLVTFGVLVAAALLIAVTSVLLFFGLIDEPYGAFYLSVLIAADVLVFVLFGAFLIRQRILRPLGAAVAATEAIAAGDLERRVPPGESQEFSALAGSINRMTDRLLEEQHNVIRAEKLASIGRLAAGIAHEIGNPLGAVNGYAYILRHHVEKDPAALEVVEALERETARIDRIVRGLLDYARRRPATPTLVDLNDTARSVVQLLEGQGALDRVRIALQLDPACPAVSGQRHDIEQMFVNLLLNAVDAMDGAGTLTIVTRAVDADALAAGLSRRRDDAPGTTHARTPSPRVRAWLDAEGRPARVAEVVIADDGPGVPDADAERIFDPFYTTKVPGKGTGLGLAIVARIVENARGVTWVQRSREGGAAFITLFPLATASIDAGAPPVAERR